MKKFLMLLALAFGLVVTASAQHRGGGYQHGGYRHHGGYGWVAPLFIGAGATYLLTRPYYVVEPPVVYYEPLPRIVPVPQQRNGCHKETRKIFDEKGIPLGEQVFLVCPLATTPPPPVVTQ